MSNNRIAEVAGNGHAVRHHVVKVATPAQRDAIAALEANLARAQRAYVTAISDWGPAGSHYERAGGYWFVTPKEGE